MLVAMFSQLIINYKIFDSLDKNDSSVHPYNETNVFVFEELHDWDEGRNGYPFLPTFKVSIKEIFIKFVLN